MKIIKYVKNMEDNDRFRDDSEDSTAEASLSEDSRNDAVEECQERPKRVIKYRRKKTIGLDAIAFVSPSNLVPLTPTPTEESEHNLKENDESKTEELEEISNISYNEKALTRFTPTYELEKFKKNALIIFNQEDTGDDPRYGTHKDVEALTRTFERFGFEVRENTYNDLTKTEIFEKLKEFTSRDFTEYGCIGVAVLTHGSHFGSLRAKDKKYSEMEIINHLKAHNKPTLVTKPKLLIIQACRGTKTKVGVPVFHSAVIKTDADTDLEPYNLPEEADMLILHSSYVGNVSVRDELNGSWFIQSLCKKIDQLAHKHDLESIITEVKREVAIDRYLLQRHVLPMQITQMPVLTSTLIRKLYLRKYGETSTVSEPLTPCVERTLSPVSDQCQVLDEMKSPLLPQFGPCSCFLDHFNYMRECLKHFVEENPDDGFARLHLDLANTLEDKLEFNTAKEKMIKVIHEHFRNNADKIEYFKYLYLCDK